MWKLTSLLVIAYLAFLSLSPVFGLHAHDDGHNFHTHDGLIEMVHGNVPDQDEHSSSVPHGPETLLGQLDNPALLVRIKLRAQSQQLTAVPVQTGILLVSRFIYTAELPNLRNFNVLFLANCALARAPPT